MKRYFLLLFFFQIIFCFSQIVNIPDANFKAKLISANATNEIAKDLSGNYFKIDSNNDGQIQVTEALQVQELSIQSSFSIANIDGINSFSNIIKLEHSVDLNSTVQLNAVDLTGLDQLIYLKIYCNNLNLGQKNSLQTLLIPKTTTLIYNSSTATLKNFKGQLSIFSGIDYLKRINVEDIIFVYFQDFSIPYEVLKYHSNLKSLQLYVGNEVNNRFGSIDFTTYNQLDNPLYPQNIKNLVLKNLSQNFPLANFSNVEDLTCYSEGSADCTNCLVFNQSNFPNLKSLFFLRKNSNPVTNLDLSALPNLKIFKTTSYTNPGTQETLSTINFGNNANLEEVYIRANPFAILNFQQTSNVKKLDINTTYDDANQTGTFSPITINVQLATNNNLEVFKSRGYTTLPSGTTSIANFAVTNLQGSSNLKEVEFQATNFVNPFIINSSTFFKFNSMFDCYYSSLVLNTPNISTFSLFSEITSTLKPPNLPDLSLDFSGVINPLFFINIEYPTLRFLSMKNGLINQDYLDIENDGMGFTICVDPMEQINSNYPNGFFTWLLPQNTVVTNNCNLSINEKYSQDSFIIYPNPVKDVLNLQTIISYTKVEVYDNSGRLLKLFSNESKKINVSTLKSGIYFLKIYTKDNFYSTKFIKQ